MVSSAAILVRSKSTWRDRHEADRQHDVVDVGDHGAERELPFEPEPEIDQDRRRSRASGRACRRPAIRRRRAGRPLRRGDIRRCRRARRAPSAPPPAARRRRPAVRRRGSARRPAAELLQLDVAEPEPAQRRAHRGDVGGAGLGLHLQQRAALEVDAEIQPVGEEQHDRDDRQQPPRSES